MRNWNFLKNGNIHKLQRFQTTYEELKRSHLMTSGFCFIASRLPMRNWNSPPYSWRIQVVIASRLPMRNWNNLWSKEQLCCTKASRLPMRNWNISSGVMASSSWSRFQTTYEELKLIEIESIFRSSIRASRLPMRNWNFGRHRGNLGRFRFQTTYEELKRGIIEAALYFLPLPDYLWGIETSIHLCSSLLLLWLPDYLWGIETWWVSGSNDTASFGFQTTYEELKQIFL